MAEMEPTGQRVTRLHVGTEGRRPPLGRSASTGSALAPSSLSSAETQSRLVRLVTLLPRRGHSEAPPHQRENQMSSQAGPAWRGCSPDDLTSCSFAATPSGARPRAFAPAAPCLGLLPRWPRAWLEPSLLRTFLLLRLIPSDCQICGHRDHLWPVPSSLPALQTGLSP